VKLGEALAQAADLQEEIRLLKARVAAAARYREGCEPPEGTGVLMAAARDAIAALADLDRRIRRTDAATELGARWTIADALAHRDHLDVKRDFMTSAADAALPGPHEAPAPTRTDLPAGSLRAEAGELARERRQVDAAIQAAAWATDLLD